ncbi:restriction endonuclease subunit S [Shewanella sp. SW32]|uniref:restriction endonuclease subunit S n=1 Tax=unclassified Shewanella TaxID=196818 RepID=UPI0021D97E27|nr:MULTISPECIES: restriction endonuclease subunit S [unclassified Shewanella]MCU7961707.1 restriction endonuclease subunit S [Shewanella sp. SW32]MCU7973398.1 restriction endonuclease subunit S [Shewanella sp. SW29]
MVPKDWNQATLESLCHAPITYGVLKPGEYCTNGTPLLQIKDLLGNLDNQENIHRISDELDFEYRRSKIQVNDILISLVGTVGRIAIVPASLDGANIHRNIGRIRTKNYEFLVHYLNSDVAKNRIGLSSSGSSQSALNLSVLRALKVPVPPLPEQQKIAEILSTWDKAIATTEKLIATSQQEKKALMQQLLTGKKRLVNPETGKVFEGDWERHTLSDLVHVDKKSLGKKTPDDFEFKYISLSDVATGTIGVNLEVHKYATAPSRARRVLQNGDVLLSTVRPNLKGFAKISQKHADCIASTGFSVLTPKKRVSGDYIYQYIFSSHVTGQIDSLVVGSNYPAINSSDVAGLKIYCPTYEEQQKIASVLTSADREIELLETKLAHLKDEKKALMQQLLTGKRRVQVN